MAQKKKLQVFISSTYSDLQEARQAAVEAILVSGHIPAGMELFAAGDEAQMNVIKRWIDESDAYMLILGGRYGTLEPKSQKSYIHLEYEYAIEKEKPLFAIVIKEEFLERKVKKYGTKVIEKDHPDKLKEFRELVCSKMVRFWSDPKDIKLSIMETMAEFSNRPELIGWILGNEKINMGVVAEEIARLTKENSELREKVQNGMINHEKYAGLSFDEMYSLLLSNKIYEHEYNEIVKAQDIEPKKKNDTLLSQYDQKLNLLYLFWILQDNLARGVSYRVSSDSPDYGLAIYVYNSLVKFNLVELRVSSTPGYRIDETLYLTEDGKRFLLRLRIRQLPLA